MRAEHGTSASIFEKSSQTGDFMKLARPTLGRFAA